MYETGCAALHELLRKASRFAFSEVADASVPEDGVYFVFEKGEEGHDTERIVRIGSHTGGGNLSARLQEHVRLNKDRSIFRKHLGRAMLQRDQDPYLPVWNIDYTSRKARDAHGSKLDVPKQTAVEEAVSEYIVRHFTVSVLKADDAEAACSLEKLCIGTVSSCSACGPSSGWLGRFANPRIAESGLWQMMHLYKAGFDAPGLPW